MIIVEYFVTGVTLLLACVFLASLLSFLFGDVTKAHAVPEKYYFLSEFTMSSILLFASVFLYWKRKRTASVVFAVWIAQFAVYLRIMNTSWSEVLVWIFIPLIVFALMMVDIRKTAIHQTET